MRHGRILTLIGSMAIVASGGIVGVTAASASGGSLPACVGQPSQVQELAVGAGTGPGAYGYYALPSGAPKGIVAVAHGYQQTALSLASDLTELANDDDVIAFAVDNTGTQDTGPGSTSSRGWDVVAGAQDIVSTTTAIDAECQPSAASRLVNSLVGISMGGDTSGIAAAAGGKRADGSALFDYWFDVSGVTNLTETYLEASADSPISPYAAEAKADIEAETGGTPATALPRYLADSPVLLAGAMKASGLRGAAVFHAVFDGLVTSDEGTQMVAALQANHVPTDFYTAVFQTPGDRTTTLDGDLLGAVIPGYTSPFAGHVGGVVWDTARARIAQLYNTGRVPAGLSVTLADGLLGLVPIATIPEG